MKIIIVNSSTPFEYRVNLFRNVMEADGHEVVMIGSDYLHIEKKKRTESDLEVVLLPTLPYKKNISFARIRSHLDFSNKAYHYIKDMPCDLLYVVIPPNSQSGVAKKYLKKHPQTKVIMDVIDLWPESFPSSRSEAFPFSIWSFIRNHNLKYADRIITECDLFHDYLKKYTSKPLNTIYWCHKENKSPYDSHCELEEGKWVLGYLGSVNNIIDIEAICEVVSRFMESRPVVIKIVGSGEKLDDFKNRLLGVGAEVVYYGRIFDWKEKCAIFSTCHYGINIMKSTVRVGLSMKAVDYMEMGLPILNGIPGDMHQIIRDYGIGQNTDDLDLSYYDVSMREKARSFFDEKCSFASYRKSVNELIASLM